MGDEISCMTKIHRHPRKIKKFLVPAVRNGQMCLHSISLPGPRRAVTGSSRWRTWWWWGASLTLCASSHMFSLSTTTYVGSSEGLGIHCPSSQPKPHPLLYGKVSMVPPYLPVQLPWTIRELKCLITSSLPTLQNFHEQEKPQAGPLYC